SESLALLPPSPQIFHGRESELLHVLNIIGEDSARIVILGTGGIGKTSLATAALHHEDVLARYSCRYFVPCHSCGTCADLLSTIAAHIGLEQGSNLAKKIAQHFKLSSSSLLVLDNLETVWEPSASRSDVETFLSLLEDIPNLGLLVTMRGAEHPSKSRWTRPFLPPLDPLPDFAALETFLDISDIKDEEDNIKQLLDLTGNLPLAVTLIAHVAAADGCASAISRWQTERTRLLSDRYDQRSSLDISIMLSFTSSRMTPEAQDLLGILAMLPDGLSDSDLVQANLPIPNILTTKVTLLRTSLAYLGDDRRLKVLVPVREYVRATHPASEAFKAPMRHFF
ncbi:P-loop containing nucleoside triphosphate hydrolase protein, partial [Mycena galericulata]